jgi:predicted acyltransferase
VQPAQRLLSLDVVRGLTIMMMATVNNPGSWDHIYAPLEHAEWNGFTPTDFVFPNFLFIVGVSIVLALSRKKERREDFGRLMLSVAKRGAILFFLGWFITFFVLNFQFPFRVSFDLSHVRIPGVLQRIGVVFVICSALFLKLSNKALAITAFSLLALYYVLLNFVPVPGYGPANLGVDTNLGAWLDRLVYGSNHLFRFTKTWDPEGLLTTIPSVATGLFGILTGLVLKSGDDASARLKKLFGFGAAFIAAGLIANFAFPINKNLWTSSYVLFTSGLSMTVIGLSYWLIDVKGYRKWTTWPVVFGVNSIFAYMFSELFPTVLRKIPVGGDWSVYDWWYETLYVPHFADPRNASLACALTLVLFMTPILWFMHKRNILVKV